MSIFGRKTLAELFMNAVMNMGLDYQNTQSAWLITGEITRINRLGNTDTLLFRDKSVVTIDFIELKEVETDDDE